MREHLLRYIDQAKSPSVRGLRILVEYFYATEIFEPIIESKARIVSVFGSARTKPDVPEYTDARKLGKLLYDNGYAVVTGASSGIMQAANEGVADGILQELRRKKPKASAEQLMHSAEYKNKLTKSSVGLKISLPFEPDHNPFVGVYATFHYFMVRKFFFGTLSSAFIACEGGWGTRDELFEILTLVQTGKAPLMPIIYISPDPKHLLQDIEYSIKKHYISPDDTNLIEIVSDYRKAVDSINRFYKVVDKISYEKPNTIEISLKYDLKPADKKRLENSIAKNYKAQFTGVAFTKRKIELTGFNYRSYGTVRKLVNEINS